MFGSVQRGASAYAKVGLETGVIAAGPHQLIVMLFDGALQALSNAQAQMELGNIAGKGQAISKAISIIDSGLRASLDKDAGGAIAQNLDALYEYMSRRLLTANLKNEPELLEEVRKLLRELKDAWVAIDPEARPAAPAMPAAPNAQAPRMPALAKA